jgi:hypothetical protein
VELARERASSLLGVRATVFTDELGRQGGPRSQHGARYDEHVRAQAARFPSATLEPLFSLFDVVGHVERFDASLLLLIDAAGLQAPLACAAPVNTQTQSCESGQAARRAARKQAVPPPTRCYNGTPGSAQWREVASAVPALVTWYEERLRRFDAMIEGRGTQFGRRVETLRTLRRMSMAAGQRSSPRGERGR